MPTVEGPITGGEYGVPYLVVPPRLFEGTGWVEEEYFVSGDATSFVAVGTPGANGRWSVEPEGTAPFTTRLVVRRPPADQFSGTVVVEWLNVSAGRDSDPDWGYLQPYLMREGIAYVGVSAQKAGIDGGAVLEPDEDPLLLAPLKRWDPERYGGLSHPGDDYSYDVFTQAGRLVRTGVVLGGLDVRRVVAVGESGSADRLATYVNAVQPQAELFDAVLLQSRSAAPAPLSQGSAPVPRTATIRTDLDQPVLQLETETDVTLLGFGLVRQPDSASVATWEIAGAAHGDHSLLVAGNESARVWFRGQDADYDEICGGQVNRGPLAEVMRAGLDALVRWIDRGTPPPPADELVLAPDGAAFVVDDLGIALGGVRTPPVDAPAVLLSGTARSLEGPMSWCWFFGQTTEFPDGILDELYSSHDDYVTAVRTSAQQAYEAGFLLAEERDVFVLQAEAADVP